MKFLKSTMAIVALLAIGSVNAKIMKKTQSTMQPVMVTENEINAYIDEIFNDNYDELADMLLNNYDQYEKQDICKFIADLSQFIVDKFPMNIPTAKKLFKEEMMGFCDSIKNDHTRIAFIQQCIDKNMNMPGATPTGASATRTGKGTRHVRRMDRYSKKTMNK